MRITTNRQLLEETIAYLKKELINVYHDLTWAEGIQAEAFRTRQARLMAELDRLEMLRRMPATPLPIAHSAQAAGDHLPLER
jgi:hypothetical protein